MVAGRRRAVIAALAVAVGILAEGGAISEAAPVVWEVVSGTSEAAIAATALTGIILALTLAIIIQVTTVTGLTDTGLTVIGRMAMVIGPMVTAHITGHLFMAIHLIINGPCLQRQLYIFNGKK